MKNIEDIAQMVSDADDEKTLMDCQHIVTTELKQSSPREITQKLEAIQKEISSKLRRIKD